VESFAQGLQQHQLATLPDGSTVLERSVTEHNLEAASKLYCNIYVAELGALLGVPGDKAEAVAGRMVMEKRLQVGRHGGWRDCTGQAGMGAAALGAARWMVDDWPPGNPCSQTSSQLLRTTTICNPPPSTAFLCGLQAIIDQVDGLITFKASAEPLQQWDRNIAGLCQAVNDVVDEAAARGIRLPAS
jgi:hypothetical protein